jgi:hypothetical protein
MDSDSSIRDAPAARHDSLGAFISTVPVWQDFLEMPDDAAERLFRKDEPASKSFRSGPACGPISSPYSTDSPTFQFGDG